VADPLISKHRIIYNTPLSMVKYVKRLSVLILKKEVYLTSINKYNMFKNDARRVEMLNNKVIYKNAVKKKNCYLIKRGIERLYHCKP
jgi:hypothetical protein